jgi:uncharacterized membrane protein
MCTVGYDPPSGTRIHLSLKGATRVTRRTFLSWACLVGGAMLLAVGWWDLWNPNQINQWWAGERVYPFYWNRLAVTLAVFLPGALLVWLLGVMLRGTGERFSLARRGQQAAWGFAVAFAIPFMLLLKYQVTWLGMNYGSSLWTHAFVWVLSVVITWLIWPALQHRGLLRRLDQQGPMLVLTLMLLYVVVYASLSIAHHMSFGTHALDLGTLDQAVWNTSRGRLLEYTPLPLTLDGAGPGLAPASRLADGKFELILLPLSLAYRVWADPRFLMVLQAILLASGAIPLYLLARTRLDDSAGALMISLAYVLYLPLHYVMLMGFHTSALLVPLLLWAWTAAEQKHWHSYYLAIGVALLCRIDAAFALFGIGMYLFLKRRGSLWGGAQRRHGAVTVLLGLGWIALNFGVVSPLAQAAYGSGVGHLLSQPATWFGQDALRSAFGREKLQAVVDLMATLGWTPLLSLLNLAPLVPLLAFDLLSPPQMRDSALAAGFAPLVPFLFIAAVEGAVRLGRWASRLSIRQPSSEFNVVAGGRLVTLFAFMTTLLTLLFFGPLPPDWRLRLVDYYRLTDHQQSLARIVDLVPTDAIVSGQNNLFAHLSRRRVIYLFPTVAEADYVVLDLDNGADKTPIDPKLFYSTVEGLLADPSFHVAAFEDGALVLQRGSGQPPPGFAENLADYNAGLYRSAIVDYLGPIRLQANNMYQAEVVLENRGTQTWQTDKPYPIYLSYHWWTPDGSLVEWNGVRNSLERAVKPEDVFAQRVRLITPARPGNYVLEWDLLHEYQAWFSDRGGITLRVDVVVE